MNQNTFPLARQKDIVVQQTNEDMLVYDLKANKALCLNETSAMIWQFCNGKNDVAEIAKQIQTRSAQPIPNELVEIALEKLNKENLLENYHPKTDKINKTSRREMIRKIGLATAIAFPIITSVVAPTAVSAASCAAGETYCPDSFLGFIFSPEGCKNLQIGTPVILFSGGEARQCNMCNTFCLSSPAFPMDCIGGVCVPV